MISKWYELKDRVTSLRKNGVSIGVINRKYHIPKSTLSGWFKKIKLTKSQKDKIYKNASLIMSDARKKAIIWHNHQKQLRLKTAENDANKVFQQINTQDKSILELALSMLYLGEGDKTNITSMANTNPNTLRFFINSIQKLYNVKTNEFRCEIHARHDQSKSRLTNYWASELNLPNDFFKVYIDKRTIKSKTYSNYRGVCVVRCGKIAIQRRLVSLANKFCLEVSNLDP